MAQRSVTSFKSTKNSRYTDNTTGLVTALNSRDMFEDAADSFLNITDHAYRAFVVTATGTNTYAATLNPAITAYATDQRYIIQFTNANTGAATLNLNALGAKSIVKNGSTALAAGDIAAGQIHILAYDGTNIQIVGSVGGGATTLASGTYTPTLTNTTNVASSNPSVCQYMRVGSVVTVSGHVDITPTAEASTLTELGMSLPIASAFTNGKEVGGTAVDASTSQYVEIFGDPTNDRATLQFRAQSTATAVFTFTFTYLIL